MADPASIEFDDETRAILRDYCGRQDLRVPREIIQENTLCNFGTEEWTLDEFRALLDAVPGEAQGKARVVYETSHYDSGSSLSIRYPRMETPEEVARNVARGLEYVAERKAADRAAYERLKRKFG